MTSGERSHHRAGLTGEHRLSHAVQLTGVAAFALVWVTDTFFLQWTTALNDAVPAWLRTALGLALLVASGLLAAVSLRTVFGENREPPAVIRTGLYGIMRHPMYFSEVLLYAGFLLLSMSIAAAVVWLGIVAALRHLCRHEERLLLERFGDEYARYMREVPLWLPRLRRR